MRASHGLIVALLAAVPDCLKQAEGLRIRPQFDAIRTEVIFVEWFGNHFFIDRETDSNRKKPKRGGSGVSPPELVQL